MRFQSQVPRTIIILMSVILTLPLSAAAARWWGPANRNPAPAAAFKNSRRCIMAAMIHERRAISSPADLRRVSKRQFEPELDDPGIAAARKCTDEITEAAVIPSGDGAIATR